MGIFIEQRLQMKNNFTFLSVLIVTLLVVPNNIVAQLSASNGWVAPLSGTGFESVAEVESDADGNVFTIGNYSGTAIFIEQINPQQLTSVGGADVFLAKHSSTGELLWSASFGGSEDENGFSIATNDAGDVYAVGSFEGQAVFAPAGPVGVPVTLNSAGRQDMFVVKMSASGELLWAKRIGGSSVDEPKDVAVDNDGNIFIVGRFVSTVDFDPGSGTRNLQAGSSPDAFIVKLTPDGDYLWAYDIGSGGNEGAEAVAVDGANNVVIAGNFSGTVDFDPGSGEVEKYGDGNADPFYLKLNKDGGFVWVKTFTSTGFVYAGDVAVDVYDNVLTHGFFRNDMNFDPEGSGRVEASIGAEDSYTAKLGADGQLKWANILGGTSIEFGYGVATDVRGDVYVTGLYYDNPDFDPGSGEVFLPSAGLEDTYLVKYTSNGEFVWVKRTGDSSSDAGYGVDIAPGGDVLLAGNFWGTADLDPEPSATLNVRSAGGSDAFVLKIDQVVEASSTNEAELHALVLSPNPATSQVVLSGDIDYPLDLEIFDVTGRSVSVRQQLFSGSESIRLEALPSGVYFLRIEQQQDFITKRFQKL